MSPLDVIIREAVPDDAADLQSDCLPTNTFQQVQEVLEMYGGKAAGRDSIYLVAEVEGHAVGQAITAATSRSAPS